jgi:type I restriction enzyme S subunit
MRDGWTDFKFKDVAKAFKGKLPKDKNELGIGLPYLTANYLRSNSPDFWIENLEGAVIAEQGECLILWDGAGAGDLFKAQNGVVSSTMAVVKSVNAKILRDFLTLFISSKANYIKETCRGTTVPHVSPDAIENMNLIIPPLAEQKRIVNLISSVDSYIESLQQQLDKASKSRNAVLHELLTKGGDDWVETTLGDVAKCAGGCAFPESYQGKTEGVPFIKVSDMNTAGNEKFIRNANNFVSNDVINKLRLRVWGEGTVIFPKVGAALLTEKRRILTSNTIFDNNIMGLVASSKIVPEYLYLSMLKIKFSEFVQPGAVPSVKNSIVEEIEINLPSIAEQKEIVEIILVFDKEIEALDSTISKTKNLRSALLSDLLSGSHEIPTTYDKLIGAT